METAKGNSEDYKKDLEKIERIAQWECAGTWGTRKDPSDGSERFVGFTRPDGEIVDFDIASYDENSILEELEGRPRTQGYPFHEQPWKVHRSAMALVLEQLRAYRSNYMFSSFFYAAGFDVNKPEPPEDEIQKLQLTHFFDAKVFGDMKEAKSICIPSKHALRSVIKIDVAAVSAITLSVFPTRSFLVFNRHGTDSAIVFGFTNHEEADAAYYSALDDIERIRKI